MDGSMLRTASELSITTILRRRNTALQQHTDKQHPQAPAAAKHKSNNRIKVTHHDPKSTSHAVSSTSNLLNQDHYPKEPVSPLFAGTAGSNCCSSTATTPSPVQHQELDADECLPDFTSIAELTRYYDDLLEKKIRSKITSDKIKARRSGKRYRLPLYDFHELPAFLQDNEYILTGYRVFYNWTDSWTSLFTIHNETANIWTHLIGFFLFAGLMIFAKWQIPQEATLADHVVLLGYYASAASCLLFSALFHTHYCQSRWSFIKFGCLDYAGISMLICGSCCLVTYFSYYCEPFWRDACIFATMLMASVGIVGPFFDKWAHRSFRGMRTVIYFLSGVASAMPIILFLLIRGYPSTLDIDALYMSMFMLSLYIGGACIYAYRIPECYWPGKFDIWFHSHQFWHVCVLSACYIHYLTALKLLDWRLNDGKCAVS